ncbi:lytic transglycosylase domain-containing protein [Streptomyces sp. WAC05292]|uniref:lytic transglycosylase domain-containing protein n=1 Tax=Streptomyces sp. WAC05292 TaxID=2487418 RepID=UPI00163B97F4|nr:lytic transglycosylase domain-containing protein [Streptomyces sp. WAC05292]
MTNPPTADAGESEPTPDSPQATDRGDARLDLPQDVADPAVPPAGGAVAGEGASGIPATALDAYKRAETAVAAALPNCKLPWQLLAGIGRVESVHASGYGLKADGYTEKPIRGPQLNGQGFAEIKDTDKGEWDGDTAYDRAVGPMQFIPSTWATWGADGSGDSKRDPNNIYDAALGAGLYLCAGDRNLSDQAQLDRAILSYNNSREYVNTVLGYMRQYQNGATEVTNPPVGTYPTPTTPVLPTPRPSTPATTPAKPSTPAPQPTPEKPKPKPEPKPEPEKPAPAQLAKLEVVDGAALKAEAGAAFTAVPRVKALLSDGKPAVGRHVLFAVEEDTTGGTHFGTEGRSHLVVQTDSQGIAAAPGLKAGPKGGTFTLRASGYDTTRQVTVNLTGTVTAKPAPVADLLERTGTGADKPLEVVAGTPLKDVRVKATAAGRPVAGTQATAALVEKNEAGAWVPVDPAKTKGPYFEGAKEGDKLFRVELDPSGADGVIALPELLTADVAPGTYHLRLTTKENVVLLLKLEVTAKAGSGESTEPKAPEAPAATPARR